MNSRPPPHQTRQQIERELADQRDISGAKRRNAAQVARHLAKLREKLDPAAFVKVEERFRAGVRRVSAELKLRKGRRPGEGSMPALVEPPRGPRPLAGGAAAPLEFD